MHCLLLLTNQPGQKVLLATMVVSTAAAAADKHGWLESIDDWGRLDLGEYHLWPVKGTVGFSVKDFLWSSLLMLL